jgi:hypothetical protein
MKNSFLFGALFALFIGVLLGASNIPQGWTLNAARTAFSVLTKDGGGTVFVPTNKGITDGSSACVGCIGEMPASVATAGAISFTTSATTQTFTSGLVLAPGKYMMIIRSQFYTAGSTITGGNGFVGFSTDASSGYSDSALLVNQINVDPATNSFFTPAVFIGFVNNTTAKTYYIKARCQYSGTAPTFNGSLQAIRIP